LFNAIENLKVDHMQAWEIFFPILLRVLFWWIHYRNYWG